MNCIKKNFRRCNMERIKAENIQVKVATVFEKGCQLLLYKDARYDMAMLDKIYGPTNWQCDYKLVRDNMYCGIGIYDKDKKEWVWKWDCGIESREDDNGNEKKGEASDAFKRAGFKWGIGVELYNSPFIFANVATYGEKDERTGKTRYYLTDRYMRFKVKEVVFDDNGKFTKLVISDKNDYNVFEYDGRKPSEKAKQTRAENKAIAEKEIPELRQKAKDCIEFLKSVKLDLTTKQDMAVNSLIRELSRYKELEELGNEVVTLYKNLDRIKQ